MHYQQKSNGQRASIANFTTHNNEMKSENNDKRDIAQTFEKFENESNFVSEVLGLGRDCRVLDRPIQFPEV